MRVEIKTPRILVINPNSTQSITHSLEEMLRKHRLAIPSSDYELEFTQPPTGPASIDNDEDGEESLPHCVAHLEQLNGFTSADGYLVACYSDHPLVTWLRVQRQIADADKPVMGIFEASVVKSLTLLGNEQSYAIVSTGKVWETLLPKGVKRMQVDGAWDRFAGVETTGLSAVELHETPQDQVRARMKEATKRILKRGNIGAVCLGCAGMAGMDSMVREALSEELGKGADAIAIVDGVLSGVELLVKQCLRQCQKGKIT